MAAPLDPVMRLVQRLVSKFDGSVDGIDREYDLASLPNLAAPVVLDIGANVGNFCRIVQARWPGAVVHCFEPHPTTFAQLRKNAAPATATQVAVTSPARGSVRLYEGLSGSHEASLRDDVRWPHVSQNLSKWVDVPSLDASTLPPCDVLKIDTEGSEVEILGGYPYLATVKVLLVEAHAVGGDLEGQKQIVAAMAGAAGLRAVSGNVMRFVRPSSSPTVGAGMVPTAVAPLISMLTPTLDRPGTHQSLYEGFTADLWPRKELVVLDESKQPSPFFSRLKDPRVRYHHEPGKPRIDGVTRIGAARNRLTQLARGAYFENRDDDDVYSPEFSGFMLDRLGGADAAKLVVYKLLHEATGLLFRWDSTKVSDKHWAILGDQIRRVEVKPGEMPADFVERMKKWFGFTLFGPRRSFERFPFPEEGTEDIRFLEDIEAAGGRIVYIEDAADMVIHAIGSGLSSHAYPDRLLGAAGASSLHAAVGAGMMASMQGMTPLPDGKPIQIVPGVSFAILAAIASRYSVRNITMRAKDSGAVIDSMRDNVSPAEFGVPAPGDGLRLVLAVGHGTVAGKTLPWKPWGFLSALEKSHIVKAWTSAPIGAGAVMESGMQLVTGAARHSSTLGPKGDEFVGAAVERYDPKRYAGKAPPHVCTAASATAIAQQLPGAPWVYAGTVASTAGMRETISAVTTPMGKKNIPVWHASDGAVVTQCPYSGQRFLFRQPTVGAGFCTMCQQPAPCNTPSCCKVRGDFFPRDRGPYREPDPALLLAGNIEYERETQTGAGKIPDRIQLTTGETIQNDCGPSNLAAMGSAPHVESSPQPTCGKKTLANMADGSCTVCDGAMRLVTGAQ